MRVLHVVTSGELGGAQVHVESVVRALIATGVDVEVACGPGAFLPEALDGVAPVHLIPWLGSRPAPFDDARSFAALVRLSRGRDVVHTHSAKAGVLGRLSARVTGVPRIVHTSHGSFLGEPRFSRLRRWLLIPERAAAAVTTHLFVLSRADLELMRSFGLYLTTPTDLIRIAPERVAHPAGAWSYVPRRPTVVAVANLYPAKGLDLLLHAMRDVTAAVPGASLVVLGEGPERPALERIARESGVAVRLVGRVPDPSSYLLNAGVFTLPSRKEGLPIALLEALALGVPSVVTRVGAIPELVHDDEAELVPPGDSAALASAIIRVLADRDRARTLSSGARRAAQRFVAGSSVEPLLTAYTAEP